MRKTLIYFIAIYLFGCHSYENQTQLITDKEWKNILDYTLSISSIKEGFVFKAYGNSEMKEILEYAYLNCNEILDYKISDSIVNLINTRKNKPITNNIDTIFNLSFITDTNGFDNDYLIYSEPFFVDDNKLCLSMLYKSIKNNYANQWVFFFKKQNESFILVEFYDLNKDMFYKTAPLK